jgi:hypothetical protein
LELGSRCPRFSGDRQTLDPQAGLVPQFCPFNKATNPPLSTPPWVPIATGHPFPRGLWRDCDPNWGCADGLPTRSIGWAGAWAAPRDRACARMEARRRIGLSRVARGERVIASRAHSDPIPLPLGTIPVLLREPGWKKLQISINWVLLRFSLKGGRSDDYRVLLRGNLWRLAVAMGRAPPLLAATIVDCRPTQTNEC